MSDQKTFTFHVHGMHCQACELLIEGELKDLPYVLEVKSNLKNRSLKVTGYFGDMVEVEAALSLTKFITKHGYTLSVEKREEKFFDGLKISWPEFRIAIPIALGFIVLFILLQKAGIVNLVNVKNVGLSTAFIVGIIASLSTCMAVVGGLVLSMSATFAKEGEKFKPQLLFHLGRIISFFILGGVIGVLGSAFQFGATGSFVLGAIISLVMIILGLNLLDVFHFFKKLQPSMPKFISKHAHGVSKFNHSFTPFLVGVATFFMPCGFTQSMQIYTLSAGSFWQGGLIMLSFALGTLPILALISFSSFKIHNNFQKSVFFKSAGLIVIVFALFNIINSLVIIGLIPPIFNF